MKITEQERRDVKKLLKLLAKRNGERINNTLYAKIASFMGISEDRVEMIAHIADVQVIGEYSNNSDGEELNIWDSIPSEIFTEQSLDELCSFSETMQLIEKAYEELQERQRPIVSDMLTMKLGVELTEHIKILNEFTFINMEMLKTISDTGVVPTQRNIAEK